ncbi:Rv3654c family TadE-like protein [Actinomyces sp. zg328]|uniref:Rv3654c family TadE-like protein n=1 Tax=Actinomyces sp. zg328 TaxID=2609287 RepID=UPI002E2E840C|nr:Rv3654c family TadE-like protein [Actinomyces sp. zg328]
MGRLARPGPSRRWGRPLADERGEGTVLMAGVIGVILAITLGLSGLMRAEGAAGRARTAADMAALAGATALNSIVAPGDPCAAAQRLASANGATLDSCRVEGEDVIVGVSVDVTVLGVPRQARAHARAGPVDATLAP